MITAFSGVDDTQHLLKGAHSVTWHPINRRMQYT